MRWDHRLIPRLVVCAIGCLAAALAPTARAADDPPHLPGTTAAPGTAPATQPRSQPPPMPWLGTKEGLSDRVLEPWTSIEVQQAPEGIRIGVWGRLITFGADGLPTQMTSQGKDLLAAPVAVLAQADGRPVDWGAGRVEVQHSSLAKAVLAGETSSRDGRLVLRTRTTIDYDGAMQVEWGITAAQPITIDRLAFQVWISGERATCYNWAYTSVKREPPVFGSIPESGFFKGYIPFLWIGDDDVGLNWWCESDRNWLNNSADRAMSISKEGPQRVCLRIGLVDHPVKLSPAGGGRRELSYTFGLMPTPVKAVHRDGWDLRIISAPAYGKDYDFVHATIDGKPQIDVLRDLGVRTIMLFNWSKVRAHITPTGHEEDLRELVKACHDRGMKVICYLGSYMAETAPEWPFIGDQIAVEPVNRFGDSYEGDTQYCDMACNRSAFQDFIVGGTASLMDEYGIDGVYLDGIGGAWYCDNTKHGCGYQREDGTSGRTFPLEATRQTVRRLYTAIKSRKPDGVLWVHTSSQMLGAITGWCDLVWDGEQFGSGERFPLEALPLDAFRTEFTGKQLGTPVDFIFYTAFRPADPAAAGAWYEAFHQAHALTLLHDVTTAATGMTDPAVSFRMIRLESSLWDLMDRFGRKEASWIPYFRTDGLVEIDAGGADVRASLYTHPRNGTLVVVSNIGRRPATAAIRLNCARLNLPAAARASDALSGAACPLENGRVSVELRSLDWRILWFK